MNLLNDGTTILRIMESNSPLQLWTVGILLLPKYQRPVNNMHVQQQQPDQDQRNAELGQISPLNDGGNYGMYIFLTACHPLERNN